MKITLKYNVKHYLIRQLIRVLILKYKCFSFLNYFSFRKIIKLIFFLNINIFLIKKYL